MTGPGLPDAFARQAFARNVGRFLADERGATSIEYAIMAGGIGVVVATAITFVGGNVKTTLYDKLAALF
jgi:Flp pilus assembly pilin Flp